MVPSGKPVPGIICPLLIDRSLNLNDCLKQLFEFISGEAGRLVYRKESALAGSASLAAQEAGVETPDRLLDAAGPIFARVGFEAATVREICRHARTNVASVGYYFGDKMGLYRAVIYRIRESRERQYPVPDSSPGLPDEELYRLVDTLLSRMLACDGSSWEFQLMMREMQSPTEVLPELVEDYFRPLFDRLTVAIARLVREGTPKHRIDQLALSVVGQCLYYRIGGDVLRILLPDEAKTDPYSRSHLVRHITAVTLSAAKDLNDPETGSIFAAWCGPESLDTRSSLSQRVEGS